MEGKGKAPLYDRVFRLFEFLKNIGILIGVPAAISVGIGIRDAQDGLLKTEIELLKTQIQELESQKYDNALAVIESQEKLFDREKEHLRKSVQMVGGGEMEFDDFLSNYMCLKLSKKP